MPTSIVHIGLPLDHPAIPLEERPRVAARLSNLLAQMRAAGYDYEILHASPETGLKHFEHRLRTQRCDGVLVGGGVAGDEEMRYFLEQIVDQTHTAAPHAKIMFHSHAVEPLETVRRWFPSPEKSKMAEPLTHKTPIAFIPTANPEAARAFYEHTLGLTFVSDDKFALVFRVGPTQTMLRVVRTGDFTPAPFTIFGWEVPDIHGTIAQLASRGVKFLRYSYFQQDEAGVWTAPDGAQIAWFKDPDGNTLSLSNHA